MGYLTSLLDEGLCQPSRLTGSRTCESDTSSTRAVSKAKVDGSTPKAEVSLLDRWPPKASTADEFAAGKRLPSYQPFPYLCQPQL
jgi:hypothetical protein